MQQIWVPLDSLAPVVLFSGTTIPFWKSTAPDSRSNKKYRRGTPHTQEVALVPEGTDGLGTGTDQAKAGRWENRCMSHHCYLSGFSTILIPFSLVSYYQWKINNISRAAVLLQKVWQAHLWRTFAWQASKHQHTWYHTIAHCGTLWHTEANYGTLWRTRVS